MSKIGGNRTVRMKIRSLFFITIMGGYGLLSGCIQKSPLPEPPEIPPKTYPQFDTSVPKEPKVGLILGPGGSKTLAHIGVLKNLEEQGIPIDAIVGYEWGALIGGLYALKGKTNTIQWQLKKLKPSHLPSKSLFSGRISPKSIDVMKDFLKKAFRKSRNQDSKVSFTCPILNLKTHKVQWEYYDLLTNMLSRCLPFPPYFKPTETWVAAPLDLKEAALKLRQKKIDIIIYVNVLAGKTILKHNNYKDYFPSHILWLELKKQRREAEQYVDEIIDIPLRSIGLIDYNAHNATVKFGYRKSLRSVQRIKSKYGF